MNNFTESELTTLERLVDLELMRLVENPEIAEDDLLTRLNGIKEKLLGE